jgi:hypothetical protein
MCWASEIAHPAILLRNESLVERKELLGREKELTGHFNYASSRRRNLRP